MSIENRLAAKKRAEELVDQMTVDEMIEEAQVQGESILALAAAQ